MGLSCGIDFGTTNLTIGVLAAGRPVMVNIDGKKPAIPTTLFLEDKQFTLINGKRRRFNELIFLFLSHLKQKAEMTTQSDLTSVVMGRPVHFQDNNPEADQIAENKLRQIARADKRIFFSCFFIILESAFKRQGKKFVVLFQNV